MRTPTSPRAWRRHGGNALRASRIARQRDIQLTTDQRKAITKQVRTTQDEVLDIQWETQDAVQALTEAAKNGNEETLVAAAEPVFRLESRIKLSQLRLMARIKQILTPTQRARLDGLRPKTKGAAPNG